MEELTKDQECNLFRAVIMCYGVKATYGAGMRMSTDRPFTDYFGVFGEQNHIYPQVEIAPYWKKVVKGEWVCPKDNLYVQAILCLVDWDKV